MYAPPAIQQLFAARIKNSTTLVVPDAGHSTYWEQPDVFNRAVLDFIRKY
jgi:pimeloyl-ACP methyl ester carboxylesterase